jgi:hypothetical protein
MTRKFVAGALARGCDGRAPAVFRGSETAPVLPYAVRDLRGKTPIRQKRSATAALRPARVPRPSSTKTVMPISKISIGYWNWVTAKLLVSNVVRLLGRIGGVDLLSIPTGDVPDSRD